jgi:hypothetical protein
MNNSYEPISSFKGEGYTSAQFVTAFWESQGFDKVPSVNDYGIDEEVRRVGPPKHLK